MWAEKINLSLIVTDLITVGSAVIGVVLFLVGYRYILRMLLSGGDRLGKMCPHERDDGSCGECRRCEAGDKAGGAE